MSNKPKITKFSSVRRLAQRLRDDFENGKNDGKGNDFILLYAYNGTGKTRLSMEFKDAGKRKNPPRDTLYFNAFTEDLFYWDNDLENDAKRLMKINKDSHFFDGFKELSLEDKIREYLFRYTDFNFTIDYDKWEIIFYCEELNPRYRKDPTKPQHIEKDYIKISRGEEVVFIWCLFLAIVQLVTDKQESYSWVKYIYIDDPISSLDDNNAIAVASDLANLLLKSKEQLKCVISSHHSLFFNVMCNELKKTIHKKYFLHKAKDSQEYLLTTTDDTPFFHHVAMLDELQKAVTTNKLYTYHFNMLRNILEKTATFFGYKDFSKCLSGIEDEDLYSRALNLLSHGKYSLYEPKEMVNDNIELFKTMFRAFLNRYKFALPELQNDKKDTK